MRWRPPEATGAPSGCGLACSLKRGLCSEKPEEVDAGLEGTASRTEEETMKLWNKMRSGAEGEGKF
jgi:hypothetical protein